MSFLKRFFQKDSAVVRTSTSEKATFEPRISVSVEMGTRDAVSDEPDIGDAIATVERKFHADDEDLIRLDDADVRQDLFNLVALSMYHTGHVAAFEALLLGQRLEWIEFDQWHQRFSSENDWPRNWFEVMEIPNAEDYEPFFEAYSLFRDISPPARFIILSMNAIGQQRLATRKEILNRVPLSYALATSGMKELRECGLLRRSTRGEALGLHKATTLRDELGRIGAKKSGNKPDLIDRLMEHASEDVLQRLVPDDQLKESRTLEYDVPASIARVQSFERERIKILTQMVISLRRREQSLDMVKNWITYGSSAEGVTIRASHDSCALCRSHGGKQLKSKDIRLEDLPPYHPGCRCWVHYDYRSIG